MKNVHVKVTGTRPILFHAFNVEIVTSLSKVKEGSAGNSPEEWKKTVLEKNGQLFLPGSYWSACLREGSKHTKAGRGTIQKTFMCAVTMKTEIALINRHLPDGWKQMTAETFSKDSNDPVYLDIRGVMNPNTKGRNVRYRIALSPGWKTEFEFSFDDMIISPSQVKKIVEDSGKMVGIADGRTMNYGRFKVDSIDISEEKE